MAGKPRGDHALSAAERSAAYRLRVKANAGKPPRVVYRRPADRRRGQLIWISLGVKHEAYSHEREVRLVILGTRHVQKDHVKTRIRGAEIVPYMESDLPLRGKGGIVDIVVGPAAAPTAKDAVQRLLQSFSIEPANLVRESDIPYRAL